MFGYVRPLKLALSEQDAARYQAAYCGLCRVIGQRYGRVAQFFLNYDFAFLAILLAEEEQSPCIACRRCPYHLWKKKDAWQENDGLRLAAAESVVLSYWKLRDEMQDGAWYRRLGLWPLRLLLTPSYRKAVCDARGFEETVQLCLGQLREMEEQRLPSLDRPADAFARILQAAAGSTREARSQLLYQLGRWIYLLDAWDDLEDDRKSGSYNPILLTGLADTQEGKRQMADTLAASMGLAQSAYEWMDFGAWAPVIENILQLGLPGMQEAVLSGQKRQDEKRCIRRSRT